MSVQSSSKLWHSLGPSEVLQRQASSESGLSPDEAARRLQEFGPNRLPEAKPRGPLLRFLAQFHNLLIYVLIMAGVVTSLLQHWLDAGVIFGGVVINALIGFIQEGKAEDALRGIKNMLSTRALVLRDDALITLDAQALVPGDLASLQVGDRVPADLRIIEAKGFQIEEAALTGESLPVEKSTSALPCETVLADRNCMAYSGTLVTRGHGMGVVFATAGETEIGRISTLLAGVE